MHPKNTNHNQAYTEYQARREMTLEERLAVLPCAALAAAPTDRVFLRIAALSVEPKRWSRYGRVAVGRADRVREQRVALKQLHPALAGVLVVVDARDVRLCIGARPVLAMRNPFRRQPHEGEIPVLVRHPASPGRRRGPS